MNPDLGHLYHDNNISNVFTALDAKEKMKTREMNARESKHLDKYSHVLDRAKTVCRRQNEWEQRNVRKQLDNIKSKTPSLDNSLRLESERIKTNRDKQNERNDLRPDHSTGKLTAQTKEVYVSSWSIYSRARTDKRVVTKVQRATDGKRINDAIDSFTGRHEGNKLTQKNANLIKKADSVTKTLHKLYTSSVERKWKENNMTVLDVLGNESREELEKALFVLRGSPAGDVIEDILKRKELVSKERKESVGLVENSKSDQDSDGVSDDVFIKRSSNITPDSGPDSEKSSGEKSANILSEQAIGTLDNDTGVFDSNVVEVGSEFSNSLPLSPIASNTSDKGSGNTWSEYGNRVDMNVNEVFERDNTWMMSSTVANPSETDIKEQSSLRWTDIFKAPELWKREGPNSIKSKNKAKQKHISVVTLTGKHRQTLMK